MVKLLDFTSKYNTIMLYGTGEYGKLVFEFLKKHNIFVSGFIVSDNQKKQENIEGITVYKVSEISFGEIGVVLALDCKFHQHIRKTLAEKHYHNIFAIDNELILLIKKYVNKENLCLYLKKNESLKIILGAGGSQYSGWSATDIDLLNMIKEPDWQQYFQEASIDNLLAEHVLEHLTLDECEHGLRLCYKYLRNGGIFRIAVPDGYSANQDYIEMVKPGGWGIGSDDHKVLYNYETLGAILKNIGFEVKLIEWFDEHRIFNQVALNDENGHIKRSRDNDKRNTKERIVYTSLIIDAIKCK